MDIIKLKEELEDTRMLNMSITIISYELTDSTDDCKSKRLEEYADGLLDLLRKEDVGLQVKKKDFGPVLHPHGGEAGIQPGYHLNFLTNIGPARVKRICMSYEIDGGGKWLPRFKRQRSLYADNADNGRMSDIDVYVVGYGKLTRKKGIIELEQSNRA